MTFLPTQFTKSGWTFQQVKREGNVAIFQRSKGGKQAHFEVVRVQHHEAFKFPGRDVETPAGEHYPSSEQWGTHGWTHNMIEDAERKFSELVAKEAA